MNEVEGVPDDEVGMATKNARRKEEGSIGGTVG